MNHAARGSIADQAPVARRTGKPAPARQPSGKTTVRNALAQIGDDPVKAAKPPAPKAAAFASTGDSIRKRVPKAGRKPKSPASIKELRERGDIIPAEAVKRGRGRPRVTDDRKAYKAQKERERRAKKKTEATE